MSEEAIWFNFYLIKQRGRHVQCLKSKLTRLQNCRVPMSSSLLPSLECLSVSAVFSPQHPLSHTA